MVGQWKLHGVPSKLLATWEWKHLKHKPNAISDIIYENILGDTMSSHRVSKQLSFLDTH